MKHFFCCCSCSYTCRPKINTKNYRVFKAHGITGLSLFGIQISINPDPGILMNPYPDPGYAESESNLDPDPD
jgi:hypothetical protein